MSTFPVLRLFFTLCLVIAASTAKGVDIEAPPEAVELLAPHLPDGDLDADPEQARRRLEKLVPELLATEGYFAPTLVVAPDARSLRLVPGPRTRVAGVDIRIEGRIGAAERESLIAAWALPVGEPFRQARWSAAKEGLLADLMAVDHAGASLQESRADIDPETHTAHLTLVYDAGPVYRFGDLKIDGLLRYRPDLVDRYNDSVHPGDAYSEERLAKFQRNLQATPYFSSVQLDVERGGEAGPDGVVTAPVHLQVREAEPHRASLSVGASSNTGARVELGYRTADLFRRAWVLNSGLRLEQKRQTLYADVFLPPDALRYRDALGALLGREDISGLRREHLSLGAQRTHQRGRLEMRLSLNWLLEKNAFESESFTDHALVASSTWTWRNVDNLLDPRRGQVLQAQVGGAVKGLLSDSSFLRLYGRGQFYFPLGRRDTLSLRGELGQVFAASSQGIPQDYLFRAGGAGSVRGYAYQGLGVEREGAILGGRAFAAASVEITHWLNEQWGLAAFVDAGDAAERFGDFRFATGLGLGARWKSPAGPIGADLAYGARDRRFRLHFSLAIPF